MKTSSKCSEKEVLLNEGVLKPLDKINMIF